MTRPSERLLLLVPPHCESSMPLLGAYQMAGYAKSIGLEMFVIDLNARFRRSLFSNAASSRLGSREGKNLWHEVRNSSTFSTHADYWAAISSCRASLHAAGERTTGITPEWDGATSPYIWNSFSDQQRFIFARQVDETWKWIYDDLWSIIDRFRPTIIGISITFESQLLESLSLLREIKQRHCNLACVVGGGLIGTCISSPADIDGPLQDTTDLVFIGDGELFLSGLRCDGFASLYGLAHGTGGHTRVLSARQLVPVYGAAPVACPAFAEDLSGEYLCPTIVLPYRLTSQCYWQRCAFCADHQYRGVLDAPSLETHLDRIAFLAKHYGASAISLLDSAIPPSKLFSFADGILRRGVSVLWSTNMRCDDSVLAAGFLETISAAGCRFLRFGIESGSQEVLDRMNKGIRVGIASRILQRCRDLGILTHAYIMVGFPGETAMDWELTHAFIMARETHPDYFSVSPFTLYARAPIARGRSMPALPFAGWHAGAVLAEDGSTAGVDVLKAAFSERYEPSCILASTAHTIGFYHVSSAWPAVHA